MNEIPNITGGAVGNVNGGVIPNGVVNNANPIPNARVGNAAIPTLNINEGPRIISTIDPPVIRDAQQSLIRSLAPPVFTNPDGSLKYPTLRVPTQAEFDEAVRAEKQAQEDEKAEKSRGLPDAPAPFIPQAVVTPPVEEVSKMKPPQLNCPNQRRASQSSKSLFSDQSQSHLKSRLFLLAPLLLLLLLRLLLANLWWNGW
jgi:hypothetical protein